MSNLDKFLKESGNSVSREVLTRYGLYKDLKLAAAKQEYDLQISQSDVDRYGYDVAFDDADLLVRVQLKTIHVASKTKALPIHPALLRPEKNISENLGFECDQFGTGYGGGVILMFINGESDSLSVSYWYLNAPLLVASMYGLNPLVSAKNPQVSAAKIINKLKNSMSHSKISIPTNLFTPAKTPEHLLGLMGLNTALGCNFYVNKIYTFSSMVSDHSTPDPKGQKKTVREYIKKASGYKAKKRLPNDRRKK